MDQDPPNALNLLKAQVRSFAPAKPLNNLSKMLERSLRGVRLCPDEWLDALSINLHCENRRGKVEALRWKLAQDLLVLGLTVIIEWGTWARSERDTLRLGARALGAAVGRRTPA